MDEIIPCPISKRGDLYMAFSFTTTPIEQPKGLINPLAPARTDICPNCNMQTIELYSFNNYPQNYKNAVEARLKGFNVSYDKYEILYMRCKNCRKEFVIDWYSGFPVPLRDGIRAKAFFDEFDLGI